MALLAKAFQASRPDTQVTVVPGLGSSGSIKAVAEAALDIGLSGRPLKPGERAQKLVERELARTPLVLASTRSHAGFTLGDIARIFDGTLRIWPDGSPLRPNLNPLEKKAMIAFLNTLTDETVLTEPKYSNPFK